MLANAKKTVAALGLVVAVGIGASACDTGGDVRMPNATVQAKWSKHDASGDRYWLSLRYSTTGNGKNITVATYQVSRATYNSCFAGANYGVCREGK